MRGAREWDMAEGARFTERMQARPSRPPGRLLRNEDAVLVSGRGGVTSVKVSDICGGGER
jgi:hypothetical protein